MACIAWTVTRYRLFFDDWRGYAIAGFSLVRIANVYMSLFGRLRLDIKYEGVELATEQHTLTTRNAPGMPMREGETGIREGRDGPTPSRGTRLLQPPGHRRDHER